jgi:abequosyltransferase
MPTYNNAGYIGDALRSVLPHAGDEVEVVVLDGGSTDDTEAVVEPIAQRDGRVRYVRQAERGGIDRDMARSVELARGEYCWLLSADDALAEGALARILRECRAGGDLWLANRLWCDIALRPVSTRPWLRDGTTDEQFDLAEEHDLCAYLSRASSLGALFSFMSVIGFRRSRWLAAADATTLVGSNYAHVQRLFAMAQRGARLKYIAAPLVLCRSGNDSFASGGVAARLAIDLRGYLALSQAVFPHDEPVQRAFRAVLRREHSWRVWMYAREVTPHADRWREMEELLRAYGFTRMQLFAIRLLAIVSGARRRRLQRRLTYNRTSDHPRI